MNMTSAMAAAVEGAAEGHYKALGRIDEQQTGKMIYVAYYWEDDLSGAESEVCLDVYCSSPHVCRNPAHDGGRTDHRIDHDDVS